MHVSFHLAKMFGSFMYLALNSILSQQARYSNLLPSIPSSPQCQIFGLKFRSLSSVTVNEPRSQQSPKIPSVS